MTTDPADAVLPGAEPFEATPRGGPDGGGTEARIGVVLCHGFTGSPQSLRAWAEHLADAGYRVSLPLLPGHGRADWHSMQATRWQDWYAEVDKAFRRVAADCDGVFVMGLSMGGALALRLAAEHRDQVLGVVVVNPSVKRNRPLEALLPILSKLVPSTPGVASDVKKPDAEEVGYDRVPLKAADSLTKLWTTVQAQLSDITAPILLFRSAVDHVVHASSSAMVLARVSSTEKEEVVLPESYHVATIDNDAPTIFAGSLAFVRRISAAAGTEAAPPGDGTKAPESTGAPL